jgi:hypothetical protein
MPPDSAHRQPGGRESAAREFTKNGVDLRFLGGSKYCFNFAAL